MHRVPYFDSNLTAGLVEPKPTDAFYVVRLNLFGEDVTQYYFSVFVNQHHFWLDPKSQVLKDVFTQFVSQALDHLLGNFESIIDQSNSELFVSLWHTLLYLCDACRSDKRDLAKIAEALARLAIHPSFNVRLCGSRNLVQGIIAELNRCVFVKETELYSLVDWAVRLHAPANVNSIISHKVLEQFRLHEFQPNMATDLFFNPIPIASETSWFRWVLEVLTLRTDKNNSSIAHAGGDLFIIRALQLLVQGYSPSLLTAEHQDGKQFFEGQLQFLVKNHKKIVARCGIYKTDLLDMAIHRLAEHIQRVYGSAVAPGFAQLKAYCTYATCDAAPKQYLPSSIRPQAAEAKPQTDEVALRFATSLMGLHP
ncbi:MAG: hypothetical protein V4490_04955 [Pseudomonadota bacterium]